MALDLGAVLVMDAPHWFPQEYATQFYYAKGILSLTATVLLICHMSHTWDQVHTWGRRLRYFSLLYFSALITYASVEQVRQQALVDWRNVGALVGMALLIITAVVSIREDADPPGRDR